MSITGFHDLNRKTFCAIRPIERWPGDLTRDRKTSQFRADWQSTCRLLSTELWHIAQEAGRSLQVAIRESMIRQDGLPRADLKALDHPGIILSFKHDNGSAVSMPCDTYLDWKDNVRAIALALEALRAVDRYGVTKSGEQYRGWMAIEPPKAEGFKTTEEAAAWLRRAAGLNGNLEVSLDQAYRLAAAKLHPDAGGSHEEFIKLQQARKMLEAKP